MDLKTHTETAFQDHKAHVENQNIAPSPLLRGLSLTGLFCSSRCRPPFLPRSEHEGGLPARINPRLSSRLDSGDSQSAEIWCTNARESEDTGAVPNPSIQPETSGGNILTALRENEQEVERAG